jgi:hypothetical protein
VLGPLIAGFLNEREGPEPSGDFSTDPKAFLVLIILGFVVGTLGHIYKSKTMVATGIVMIFLATVGIPLFLHATR